MMPLRGKMSLKSISLIVVLYSISKLFLGVFIFLFFCLPNFSQFIYFFKLNVYHSASQKRCNEPLFFYFYFLQSKFKIHTLVCLACSKYRCKNSWRPNHLWVRAKSREALQSREKSQALRVAPGSFLSNRAKHSTTICADITRVNF